MADAADRREQMSRLNVHHDNGCHRHVEGYWYRRWGMWLILEEMVKWRSRRPLSRGQTLTRKIARGLANDFLPVEERPHAGVPPTSSPKWFLGLKRWT